MENELFGPCDQSKKTLSEFETSVIETKLLDGKFVVREEFTRQDLEAFCEDIFKHGQQLLTQVLDDA